MKYMPNIAIKSVFDFHSRLGNNFLRNLDQYIKNKNLELLDEHTFNKKYKKDGGRFQIPPVLIGFTECLGAAITSSIFTYSSTHFIYFYKNNISDFYVDFNSNKGDFNFNKSENLSFPFQNITAWKIAKNEEVPEEYLSFMGDIRYFGLGNAERFISEI